MTVEIACLYTNWEWASRRSRTEKLSNHVITPCNFTPFTRNTVTNLEATDFLTDADHFTYVFVADNHWNRNGFLRPLIPIIDVNISTADCRFLDSDKQIVMTQLWLIHFCHPDAFFRLKFR